MNIIYWLIFAITFFLVSMHTSGTMLGAILHGGAMMIFIVWGVHIKLKSDNKN